MSWRLEASCRGLSITHFFPEDGPEKPSPFVKQLCAECPVQSDCLAEAVARPGTEGIWGGQSTKKRRKVRYAVIGANKGAPLRPHGTYAAYRRHKDEGTAVCEPCREAGSKYLAEWRARKANSMTGFGRV